MASMVGRHRERKTLREVMASDRPELVAVYGRRRIGKTYLIRQAFARDIVYELVGNHEAARATQLRAFANALQRMTSAPVAVPIPRDWVEAFHLLASHLQGVLKRARRKRVVFFDELPWLATPRSGFLEAFEHFWNSWASRQEKLVVVICGSAASWMLHKVLRQRGGLHNRVTRRLRLDPFSLSESEALLARSGIRLGRYQTLQLFMAFGGVPHYLAQVERGESATQAIDRLCFARGAPLRDEFPQLYEALFTKPKRHEAIVRALASRRRGLSRSELLDAAGLATGGGTSKVLDELIESGFVMTTPRVGRTKRDMIYRLADPYSLFYLRFIEGHRGTGDGAWFGRSRSPAFRAWSGLTFETVCLTHIASIKRALGIGAVETESAAWSHSGSAQGFPGAQIDLVIERSDQTINLCEMKFCEAEFTVDKRYARELRTKRAVFQGVTGTKKALLLTMITTFGVRENLHTRDLALSWVTLDALFG